MTHIPRVQIVQPGNKRTENKDGFKPDAMTVCVDQFFVGDWQLQTEFTLNYLKTNLTASVMFCVRWRQSFTKRRRNRSIF